MKFYSLNQLPIYTDDFFFRFFYENIRERDALVIHNPMDAMIVTPVLPRSRKTLEEHVELINKNNIKKAIIAANDISFLKRCPTLEFLEIHPSIDAINFDYSTLYEMPNIQHLYAETMYGLKVMYDVDEKVKVSSIDYSRIRGLKKVIVSGALGHYNIHLAENVVSMDADKFPDADNLLGYIPTKSLECLGICESSMRSLEGIQNASKLRKVDLSYNRRLQDISSLVNLKESLTSLEIDRCGKIKDFSVLHELSNLEYLTLNGSNEIEDLSFLSKMPKLKRFSLTMNVLDGDLSLCMLIPSVKIKNRKHYNLKDKDMPKIKTD